MQMAPMFLFLPSPKRTLTSMTYPLRTLAQTSSFGKPFQVVVALGLLALAFQPGDACAQNPIIFGGQGIDEATDIVVDGMGNVYVTGSFEGTVDFDPGPGTEERSSEAEALFVASYDSAGSLRFVNATERGNSSGNGIAVDGMGNVYVTGSFEGTVDFDPGPGTEERSSEAEALFVASYDSAGSLRFVSVADAAPEALFPYSSGSAITLDRAGNVYITGTFAGIVDFDPGPGTEKRSSGTLGDVNGAAAAFMVSYDGAGALRFASAFSTRGSSEGDYAYSNGISIAVDEAGNIYVTGSLEGIVDFDPGPGTEVTDCCDNSAFIASYDATTGLRFVNTFASSAESISIDRTGNIYVTGRFQGTIDFDFGPGTAFLVGPENSSLADSFLASYSSTGTFRFANNIGANLRGTAVTVDESGNAYVTNSLYFSLRVFGYTPTGALRFTSTIGATNSERTVLRTSVALGGSSNVYVAGPFSGTVDFDPGSGTEERTSNGDTDVFILKLGPDGLLPSTEDDTTPPECELVSVTPGPPTTLRVRLQDTESGLAAVRVLQSTNATVTLPDFDPGTTDELFATAEKLDEGQRATVVLEAEDMEGNTTVCDPVLTTLSAQVPEAFALEPNYPNPFNPTTAIRFRLAEVSDVRLSVYDVTGREVAVLVQEPMEAGSYEVEWAGRDASGRELPSGVYLYRIEAGTFTAVRTMALVK